MTWVAAPIFGVRKVREAAEYYRDVLGFELDEEEGVFQPMENNPQGVYAIVKRYGVQIHFQIRRGALPQKERSAVARDAYVYVSDLDSIYSELTENEAMIVQEPTVAPYGLREFVVEDLNGFRIAFGERV